MEKKWIRPQLVVISRGQPEESVLDHCKHKDNPANTALNAVQEGCASGDIGNCSPCADRGSPS